MSTIKEEISKRRTFAIISHPDAGKTTLTEKFLLFGGAIQTAGAVKNNKITKTATSDFMEIERQRGISVATSVMAFNYKGMLINLLDTPGHRDFAEDTYRTLTAVDSVILVIDCVKGVEAQTERLMEVCRMRKTPVIVFVNKMDLEGQDPFDLLDELEEKLDINVRPLSWPISGGATFQGVYNLFDHNVRLFQADKTKMATEVYGIKDLQDEQLDALVGEHADQLREDVELIDGVYDTWDTQPYLDANVAPVFFGSAVNNFGIQEMLDTFIKIAPLPSPVKASSRVVHPEEEKLTGFVFKIHANIDPKHRDRIAFLRICSGKYTKGMKIHHVRLERDIKISNALTFMAGNREQVEEAWPGDIIGLHNHGTIQVGDTFTQGEKLNFSGIPYFSPELFKRVHLKDPLKLKALQKGLIQLGEEGATQVFKPLNSNDLILGAVGVLQFDVVSWRLKEEYSVECSYDNISVSSARWITCTDNKMLDNFKKKASNNLAIDGGGYLTYLAPSQVNLNLVIERWPDITFNATREH